MKKALIIVESPAKARTIAKYVGREVTVKASVGHIKDLPKSKFGVDVAKGFKPQYTLVKEKKKYLDAIKKAAAEAEIIYLAPDPDREGEAIAYQIAEELDGKRQGRIRRVLFHEITERAIREALRSPGRINLEKVHAQQARRILDRIVGYTLSPLLWDKVKRGLSAGRVQSVALRLICEREQEVKAFTAEEYWTITAQLEGATPPAFTAKLVKQHGQDVRIRTEAEAQAILEALRGQTFTVAGIEKKGRQRHPTAPFITSRLQQDAARKLRFTGKRTMRLAQDLYEGMAVGAEGLTGLITYMRTDSTRVAPEAQTEARGYIEARFGRDFLPKAPPHYKNKKTAQDAHEAIRPTSVARDPDQLQPHLSREHALLYTLIWQRFVASQMASAQQELTRVELTAGDCRFRATGTVTLFPGFTALYAESQEDGDEEGERGLPVLAEGQTPTVQQLEPKQHFTQPPPRYTEALLIKELEEKGIGRPSTYHTIVSTIQDREYVERVEGRFRPSDLGTLVNGLLVEHFPDVLNIQFTAQMEEELDEVEAGRKDWVETVRTFYEPFTKHLERAKGTMTNVRREGVPTDVDCERCGKKMVIKWGKAGRFLGCPGYPDCRNTQEFVEENGQIRIVEKVMVVEGVCERCGSPLVSKAGRFGRFLACSSYPDCKFTKNPTLGVTCTQEGCGGDLVERRSKRGKVFYACSRYPACTYVSWDRPLPRPCPTCGAPFLVQQQNRQKGTTVKCPTKTCGYVESA